MLALWASAIGIRTIATDMASTDLTVWLAALLIQSIPYTAALLVSLGRLVNVADALKPVPFDRIRVRVRCAVVPAKVERAVRANHGQDHREVIGIEDALA